MQELIQKIEALLLKKEITRENNKDYQYILDNCLEAVDDKLPQIVKEELDNLKRNKGELKKGWIVKIEPGATKMFEVIEASPSSCTLENVANPNDRIVNVSSRSPYIIVDKGEDDET